MFSISDEGARELAGILTRMVEEETTTEDRLSAKALVTVINYALAIGQSASSAEARVEKMMMDKMIDDIVSTLLGGGSFAGLAPRVRRVNLMDLIERATADDPEARARVEQHRMTCPCPNCAEWRRQREAASKPN